MLLARRIYAYFKQARAGKQSNVSILSRPAVGASLLLDPQSEPPLRAGHADGP
jgi:hypothetical protein